MELNGAHGAAEDQRKRAVWTERALAELHERVAVGGKERKPSPVFVTSKEGVSKAGAGKGEGQGKGQVRHARKVTAIVHQKKHGTCMCVLGRGAICTPLATT